MGSVGDRLERDLGSVEGTASSRATRLELLGTPFFALLNVLRPVFRASRFVE
jgi:hypothetical protein